MRSRYRFPCSMASQRARAKTFKLPYHKAVTVFKHTVKGNKRHPRLLACLHNRLCLLGIHCLADNGLASFAISGSRRIGSSASLPAAPELPLPLCALPLPLKTHPAIIVTASKTHTIFSQKINFDTFLFFVHFLIYLKAGFISVTIG